MACGNRGVIGEGRVNIFDRNDISHRACTGRNARVIYTSGRPLYITGIVRFDKNLRYDMMEAVAPHLARPSIGASLT